MDFNPDMSAQMETQQSQFGRPAQAGPQVQPGGFWIRFLAVFIDNIIVSILVFPVSFIFGLAIPLLTPVAAGGDTESAVVALTYVISYGVNLIVFVMYVGFFYSRKGATPGKMLFKLSVVNANDGTYLTFTQAVMRDVLGKFVSTIILFIGFIMAAFDPEKRALHDRMFGTQVIRKVS